MTSHEYTNMISPDDFAHLKIPLENILSATNNFDDENICGEDAYETYYKVQLLWSGELINIFAGRLNKECFDGEQQFWTEVSILSSLKHKNMVSFVGFCDDNDEKVTIIKNEFGGSLRGNLKDSMRLTWVRRLEISVGIAQALSYIHYDESRDFSVIHCNINSSLIYLNDDWEPILGDFIYSMKIKASERHNSFNKVWSTEGYTDPTCLETKTVSHKSDIYSFGIVMFELLCGRRSIIDDQNNKYLTAIFHYKEKKLDEIINSGLRQQMDSQSFNMFAEIAYDCVKEERSQRPGIDEIVPRLVKALDLARKNMPGNVIHCTAKATVAHNFLKLKEGAIYSIKNFVVMQNKEDFRIRKDDTFMLEFNGSTSIRKSLVISKGFVRYPLQLVDFDHIKPTENKYLIDVVGYVTNVGRMNYTKTGAKNLDFYLANHRGQSIRLTLWGGLADVLIKKKATHVGMCPVVVISTSAKQYNNKLYLSSSSSTQLLDSVVIPAIKELNSEICITDASKGVLRVDNSEPREGSIENLLMWARNKRNDSAAFIIKAKIDNVRTRKGWNFPSCGGDNCRKGATRKNGRFWCESCSRPVEYPVIRYRLELGISDGTEQTVVVLFDDASIELIGFSALALVSDEDEGLDDHANLPSPIADLIGTTHVFEIKSHTYYEYGTFESFTCWQVDPHNPSAKPTSASTVDNETGVTGSSSKSPAQSPTLTTPSKPVEDRIRKRVVFDDSATEHELLPVNDVQGDESDIASNNTSSTSSPSFKRLIKANPSNDNKDDSVDIENDADIELITVDIEQDGDDSTLPFKKKQRRFVVEESE